LRWKRLRQVILRHQASLRTKLVAIVVIGVMVAFGAIGVIRVQTERRVVHAEMQRSAQERVDLIAQAVANLLIGFDYSNMESLAARIVQQRDVRSVVISNLEGKTMVARRQTFPPNDVWLAFEAPVLFGADRIGKVELEVSLAKVEAEATRIYRDVFAEQAFFGFFVGLMLFVATSSAILRPISRISSHMRELLDGQDSHAVGELRIDSRDEIGDLARVFVSLNRKLQDAQQRLREKVDLAGSELMKTHAALQQRSGDLEQRTVELEKALALVERLAVTDSLTELRNRRYFDDRLASAFARAQRSDDGLCLVLLDIDNFKQINDTWGHGAGDVVLQTLAKRFRLRTRETDIAARLGGDEFAFLLFRSGRDDAVGFAHSLLATATSTPFRFQGEELRVGVSIGVACAQDQIHSIEALYGAADEALYTSKRNGRGQVTAHRPSGRTGPAQ
jgi:diguanylate cyclase (GGDEF)-like protein